MSPNEYEIASSSILDAGNYALLGGRTATVGRKTVNIHVAKKLVPSHHRLTDCFRGISLSLQAK
jgi:hypothetical protein